VVGVGEVGGELLILLQIVDGFADLAPHCVRGGEIDHVPCLALM
jgi:hypothetical protein